VNLLWVNLRTGSPKEIASCDHRLAFGANVFLGPDSNRRPWPCTY